MKKRIKVNVFLGICLLAVVPARLSADEGPERSKQLMAAYIEAVRTDDPKQIKSSWTALNNDEEALNDMRMTMPRLDYLFRIRGLYMQIQELQASRPEFFGGQNPTLSLRNSVNTLKTDLSPQVVEQVSKFSLSESDKTSGRTNRDIVLEAQGRALVDNRDIALGNPNQNRIDNQEYVRNRVDRMFSKKFQTAPSELVPRGNSFPKMRPGAEAARKFKEGL